MMQTPGYWMHETSGVLRPAVEAYVRGEPMTEAHIAAMRAYFRQWIAAPTWQGENIEHLRTSIDGLTSRDALSEWVRLAEQEGIDPL